jgi:hypothetical protein
LYTEKVIQTVIPLELKEQYDKILYIFYLIYSLINYVMFCKVLGIKMVTGTYEDMSFCPCYWLKIFVIVLA